LTSGFKLGILVSRVVPKLKQKEIRKDDLPTPVYRVKPEAKARNDVTLSKRFG